MKTTISCIIPALNEEANIEALLHSIKEQNLKIDMVINEIIVLDNGSSDRTVDLAKNLQKFVV